MKKKNYRAEKHLAPHSPVRTGQRQLQQNESHASILQRRLDANGDDLVLREAPEHGEDGAEGVPAEGQDDAGDRHLPGHHHERLVGVENADLRIRTSR